MTQMPLWDFLRENHLEINVLFLSRFCSEHALRAKELSASVKVEIGRQKKRTQKNLESKVVSVSYTVSKTPFFI